MTHDRSLPRSWVGCGDFLKLGLPYLGVPIIRIIAYWGLCWGPMIFGKYLVSSLCVLTEVDVRDPA